MNIKFEVWSAKGESSTAQTDMSDFKHLKILKYLDTFFKCFKNPGS